MHSLLGSRIYNIRSLYIIPDVVKARTTEIRMPYLNVAT